MRIAEEFNIAVVVINQCMADPGVLYKLKCIWRHIVYSYYTSLSLFVLTLGALSMFGPVVKPVGGHVLAHASTTRVMLKKGKGDQRIAKIFDRCVEKHLSIPDSAFGQLPTVVTLCGY